MRNTCFYILFLAVVAASLTSCIVQAPKYAPVENVIQLKLGMNEDQVREVLRIPPYDIKSRDSSGYVYIYKYRVTERNTIPLFMKPTNGVKARGKWVDVFITFSPEGEVMAINSCSECGETEIKERKVDINALITIITLTLPTVLVYLGLK